jgi:hypothetical protein
MTMRFPRHALAYLLIELCKHTAGPAVDRAWSAVDPLFPKNGDVKISSGLTGSFDRTTHQSLSMWRSFLALHEHASSMRQSLCSVHNRNHKTCVTAPPDSAYGTEDCTPGESSENVSRYGDALRGDPFLGSSLETSNPIDWTEMDAWLQSHQSDILEMGGHVQTPALSWW